MSTVIYSSFIQLQTTIECTLHCLITKPTNTFPCKPLYKLSLLFITQVGRSVVKYVLVKNNGFNFITNKRRAPFIPPHVQFVVFIIFKKIKLK